MRRIILFTKRSVERSVQAISTWIEERRGMVDSNVGESSRDGRDAHLELGEAHALEVVPLVALVAPHHAAVVLLAAQAVPEEVHRRG